MARKYPVNEINLDIYDFYPFENERNSGFVITWTSDIGFGEYTIYKPTGCDEWYGDSECMDSNEDKDFIRELMKVFVDKLIVEE